MICSINTERTQAAKTRQNIDQNILLYSIHVSIEILPQCDYEQSLLLLSIVIMIMVINNADNTLVNNWLSLSTETENPVIGIFIMPSLLQYGKLLN